LIWEIKKEKGESNNGGKGVKDRKSSKKKEIKRIKENWIIQGMKLLHVGNLEWNEKNSSLGWKMKKKGEVEKWKIVLCSVQGGWDHFYPNDIVTFLKPTLQAR